MALEFSKPRLVTKPFFRASLQNDGTYELLIYESIGEDWWSGGGITAKGFKDELDRAGNYARIALRINSPGGDAFEGVAILNMLRAQKKPIDVYVDGLAASAASVIAMCGDTITMGVGAMMMIHNAWSVGIGNAAEMERQANALNAIDKSIAQVYASKSGMSVSDCLDLMGDETWMTADECVKNGFATAKAKRAAALPEGVDPVAMARDFKALKRFGKVPAAFRSDDPGMAAECECDCQSCQDGKCSDCSNEACKDSNCKDCPMQAGTESRLAQVIDPTFAQVYARMVNDHARGAEVRMFDNANEILAVRCFKSGVLNLASAPAGSSAKPKVSGLLVPYDCASSDLGGFQEIYQPGCFNKWLGTDDQRILAYHNMEKLLGRKSNGTARFWEEPDGLHYEAELPDTQAGRDIRVLMERGDLRESSAAFYILDYAWENRSGVRTRIIKEARLVEGSPHSFAAYGDTTAAVSADVPIEDSGDYEFELLRARHELLMLA